VLVSVGTMAAMYVIFEVWFLVPLPKGPVESFLHID
jgi:putative tricarboxylic transport membrane protein